MALYILKQEGKDAELHTARPTQELLKERGVGVYDLRKIDGSLSRRQTVRLTQKGNLAVDVHLPTGLEGISTVNLNRLNKKFDSIVKLWPAKQRDQKAVQTEIQARTELIAGLGDVASTLLQEKLEKAS